MDQMKQKKIEQTKHNLSYLGLCHNTLTSVKTPQLHENVMCCIAMWGL